jgi:hypothetical protein
MSNLGFICCINKEKSCYYNELINSNKYFDYLKTLFGTDEENNIKRNNYVCGNNKGDIIECCSKDDKDADTIMQNEKLIKIIKDNNGNIIEYRICNCPNKICESVKCKDFKKPTKYEACKARANNSQDKIKINNFEYKILPANTYPDCFSKCSQN